MFQAITQARNTLHGHRKVLDKCNIHVEVSSYSRERWLTRSRVISTDGCGICMWLEGEAIYSHLIQKQDGDSNLLLSISVGTCE